MSLKKVLLILGTLACIGLAFGDETSFIIRRDGGAGGGGGAPPPGNALAWESTNTGTSAANVTSSTQSVTVTANTKVVATSIAMRRNASQTINSVKFNGFDMQLATSSVSGTFRLAIYVATGTVIPSAGTYNLVTIISASSPGLATRTMTFTGTTSGVGETARNSVTSAANSTISAGGAINDMWIGSIIVADYSLSQPTLSTTDVNIATMTASGGTSGNGGWFGQTYKLMDGLSQTETWTWGSSRGYMHCGAVITQ